MTRSAVRTSWPMPMPSAAPTRAHRVWTVNICGHRGIWGAAVAWRTGACAPGGELPTGSYQKSVHTEGQWQTQAIGHLDAPCIMHLVQFGLRDGTAIRGELATHSR